MKYRDLYPANWQQLASTCKEQAGWCCEHCGLPHGTQVIDEETGVVSTVVLAASHLDHDPWNPAPRLAALCRSCHARYDYSYEQRQRWLELEQVRHQMLIQSWLSQP
jgi:hypothetical protein